MQALNAIQERVSGFESQRQELADQVRRLNAERDTLTARLQEVRDRMNQLDLSRFRA